jgi:hypothetical protein
MADPTVMQDSPLRRSVLFSPPGGGCAQKRASCDLQDDSRGLDRATAQKQGWSIVTAQDINSRVHPMYNTR